jgi:hypothetical protein
LVGIVAWGFSLFWQPPAPPRYEGLGKVEANIPTALIGYQRGDERVQSKRVLDQLAAADIVSFPYTSQTGWFDLTLIGGTDRSALHDPRSCLVGAGWKIVGDREETLPGTDVRFRRAVATGGSDDADYEFLYVYVVGDKTINHVTQIRAQMLMSALIGRKNTPVCFVRFQRPIPKDGTDDPMEAQRFREFVAQMWNTLKVPGNI